MKNKHILNLGQEIPIKIRLEIYKDTLKFYKEDKRKHGCEPGDSGLCIVLPCILWDLNSYLDNTPNGEDWNYHNTAKSFPEIKEFIYDKSGFFINVTKRERIAELERIINLLETKDYV